MTSRRHFDVLVIGGGPAGMAAAARAAESGSRVGILDDNLVLGGQIWRGTGAEDAHALERSRWHQRLPGASVTLLSGYRVVDQPATGVLKAESASDDCELQYDKLIVATGARERFLPFPGWTLPNVMGAGGLQAMVKSGLPIHGKKVIVIGTGPLLPAVAIYLRKRGAAVLLIGEQAPWSRLAQFAAKLVSFPQKIREAFELKKDLDGIPFAANCWPVAAHGKDRLQLVTVLRAGKRQEIACDFLACGFHLVPNVELPVLLGCELDRGCVQVDDFQQTNVPSVYCAGEPTGIGGVEAALVEGEIAGLAVAGKTEDARNLFAARKKTKRFQRMLDQAFALRPELKTLAQPDTFVCRCEDVPRSRLQPYSSWRAAKLHTRCGMGPCQGRVCGPAAEFLFGWKADSVRPPIFPARVENLAALMGAGQKG